MVSIGLVDPAIGAAAAASRDAHVTLRRVERQQHLIERLHASPRRLTLRQLADDLGVAERTIARDIDRLRHSGVPVDIAPGRGGGATIEHSTPAGTVELDLPEIAALMSSLAALGPTASASAASAMRKLTSALRPASPSGPSAQRTSR
jgi:predicted DNA-binding transcriptional regulator YafY